MHVEDFDAIFLSRCLLISCEYRMEKVLPSSAEPITVKFENFRIFLSGTLTDVISLPSQCFLFNEYVIVPRLSESGAESSDPVAQFLGQRSSGVTFMLKKSALWRLDDPIFSARLAVHSAQCGCVS